MKNADQNIILIATANRPDFETLRALLDKYGIEAVECVDGIDIIRKACTLGPGAIIIDSGVRKLNAFQCARILKNDPVLCKIQRVCVTPALPIEQYWSSVCGFDLLLPYPVEESTASEVIEKLSKKKKHKKLFQPESLLNDLNDGALFNMALSLAEQELVKANVLNEINMIDVVSLTFDDLILAVMSILDSLFDFDLGAVMITQQPVDEILFYVNGTSSPSDLQNLKRISVEHIEEKHRLSVDPEKIQERIIKEKPEKIESDVQDLYFHTSVKAGICSLFLFQGVGVNEMKREDQSLLETALDLCQSVIDKKIYFQKSQELSIIDADTGGLSTTFFYTVLQREISNAERCGHPLILFSVKIADFDTLAATAAEDFGPDKSSAAFINDLILKGCRKSDIVARLGKASFVFLVTYIPLEKAQIARKRICDFLKDEIKNILPENSNAPFIENYISQYDPAEHKSVEQLLDSVV